MPGEGNPELESIGELFEDTYIDSELLGKFWLNDYKSSLCKPAKEALGTFIFNNCDEKVILHCNPENLTMEGLALSDESDGIASDRKGITRSVVLGDELNAECCIKEPSHEDDHEDKCENSQDTAKQTKVKSSKPSSIVVESNYREENSSEYDHHSGLDDQEMEYVLPYSNDFLDDIQDNINIIGQYSGSLPYSGSISLRSTSSTASTQSFAFPVLTHTWNSSPMRMPKPDKRQLKKQKHSKIKLFWVCCKY